MNPSAPFTKKPRTSGGRSYHMITDLSLFGARLPILAEMNIERSAQVPLFADAQLVISTLFNLRLFFQIQREAEVKR